MNTLTSILGRLNVPPHLSTEKEIAGAVATILAAEQMGAAERDTLRALFRSGPLFDGDIPSKAGRDLLVEKGFAVRVIVKSAYGYNACTNLGADAYGVLEVDGS